MTEKQALEVADRLTGPGAAITVPGGVIDLADASRVLAKSVRLYREALRMNSDVIHDIGRRIIDAREANPANVVMMVEASDFANRILTAGLAAEKVLAESE